MFQSFKLPFYIWDMVWEFWYLLHQKKDCIIFKGEINTIFIAIIFISFQLFFLLNENILYLFIFLFLVL